MKNSKSIPEQTEQSAFPIPFSKEQLHQDILEIYLLQLRTTVLIADENSVWSLTNKPGLDGMDLRRPDFEVKDYGLSYSDISNTKLAKALEQEYDYAFHGVVSLGLEKMEDESIHTWIAAHLMDLESSHTVSAWADYGLNPHEGISRCFFTCELANARLTMEGEEGFSYFSRTPGSFAEDATAHEALTVRQMALLSGMEEMTIRTAASRKSANPLQTYKEDRQTLISAEVAKAWLIAKNRYVPITRRWAGGDLNLEITQFADITSVRDAIRRRVDALNLRRDDQDNVRPLMEAALGPLGYDGEWSLDRAALLNADLMAQIAGILQLPQNLLTLRAREAVLNDDLTTLSGELASLKKELRASVKNGPAA